MSTIKVLLYTSKVMKNGEHPIMLRVTQNRKSKYVSIGYSCRPELWDTENNSPSKKHPNKKLLDIVIKQKCIDTEKLLLSLDEKKKHYSLEDVRNKIKRKNGSQGLIPYIEGIVSRLQKANKIGNATVYNDLKRSLSSFAGVNLLFSDITVSFLKKYEQNFLENKVKENSISYYMRTIRSVFNKAIADGEIEREMYPFDEYKISKLNTTTIKRAIPRKDIRVLEGLGIDKSSRLFNSLNYFLFSFYNGGKNFTDIALLTWQNIQNERLVYKRTKTGKIYNIALLPPAKKILDFYAETQRSNEDYIFPILSHSNHKTETSRKNRIHKIIGQTNSDLKTLSKEAKLNTVLTTYVARHSYATILKQNGISTSIISEALGHSSEKTTQIYLDSFENSVLDEANKSIL
ncbi:MAG: hypothetical protein CVU05_08230 [Bacteroidetes bacterium HGW-Bacteroidetes-21]|nr:MAG: hypothetical protein CVU05_08230 [Bacteroidetes bacterium HGW-Bacteroidetes-21]